MIIFIFELQKSASRKIKINVKMIENIAFETIYIVSLIV